MKKKIFITGIAGFLGSHLADAMLKEGYIVEGNDNFLGGTIDNLPAGVHCYEADCRNLDKMTEIMKGADIVYHCAAAPYEGLSVFSPTEIVGGIVTGTTATVTAAIRNKVKRFIYMSSMARYGNNKYPFTEDMIPAPEDPYGISKVAGEDILKMLSEIHDMEYVIAVPHNIIGPRQKYDDPFRNVVSIMINLMLQGRQPIIYGDGQQKRCFSDVDDVIPALVKMATEDGMDKQIFNVGPDEEFITINELAQRLSDILNVYLKPEYYPGRPQEVEFATCSSDKLRNIFNYETKWSLMESLRKMIDDIKNKGTKPFEYHIDIEIQNDKTPKTWTERKF